MTRLLLGTALLVMVSAAPTLAADYKVINQSSVPLSEVFVLLDPGKLEGEGADQTCKPPSLRMTDKKRLAPGESLSFEGPALSGKACYQVMITFSEEGIDGTALFTVTGPTLAVTDALIETKVQSSADEMDDF
jgi:hypothetical protein